MATEELFAQDMALATRYIRPTEAPAPTLAELAVSLIAEMTAPDVRYRVVARRHLLAEARTYCAAASRPHEQR